MNDTEHEPHQENLDVQIMDIPGVDADAVAKSRLATFSSRLPLASRFTARQRKLQLTITASIVVLAVILVLASSVPVRNLILGPQPTPTATLVPGVDLFYIDGGLPWAHVFLDGHPITHLPTIGIDAPLRLARGHHQLVWHAEPFPAQSCTITVPPSIGANMCFANSSIRLKSGFSAWIITFSVSLTTLPAVQRAALTQAAQMALDAQQSGETVRPGESYNFFSGNGYSAATQPLRATLHFQLDRYPAPNEPCVVVFSDAQACTLGTQNCHAFCPNPEFTVASPLGWNVFGVITSVWDYATLDGHSIAHNDGFGGAIGEFLVPLRITWDGATGWHVIALFDHTNPHLFGDPTCAEARDEVQSDTALRSATLNNTEVAWKFASGSVHAAGCVAVAVPKPSGAGTQPSSPKIAAYCLHRFGLLLAANAVAHHLWPDMPVADAYEQSLAQSLVTENGLIS